MSEGTAGAAATRYEDALRQRLQLALDAHDRDVKPATGLIQAAVALVIVPNDQDDHAAVVLTRRAAKLRRHSGQFALPGGRL
ncbi:MAG: CoA pyrophosphatase, partial [Acidobacteriota bacterium]